MGGYSGGVAVEDGDDNNRLSTFQTGSASDGQHPMGYDTGWVAPCKDKNMDHEITADVAQIAPGL
jgi:hypothetical protein